MVIDKTVKDPDEALTILENIGCFVSEVPQETVGTYYCGCFDVLRKALTDLKDCRNELCLFCGKYKKQHEGWCDGCRWKH